jgi:hypothetical protein
VTESTYGCFKSMSPPHGFAANWKSRAVRREHLSRSFISPRGQTEVCRFGPDKIATDFKAYPTVRLLFAISFTLWIVYNHAQHRGQLSPTAPRASAEAVMLS